VDDCGWGFGEGVGNGNGSESNGVDRGMENKGHGGKGARGGKEEVSWLQGGGQGVQRRRGWGGVGVDEYRGSDALPKAANIGTALMVINSHRTLILSILIAAIVPPLASLASGGLNRSTLIETSILHKLNVDAAMDCSYLEFVTAQWNRSALTHSDYSKVVRANLLPVRCAFQCEYPNGDGITYLDGVGVDLKENSTGFIAGVCGDGMAAGEENIRSGALSSIVFVDGNYRTEVVHDSTDIIRWLNLLSFVLQIGLGLIIHFALDVLRSDVNRLVIVSLRRMLKIVLRYAQNPLAVTPAQILKSKDDESNRASTPPLHDQFSTNASTNHAEDHLGSETTQLIAAVTKITALLRKCWGVAGAGIISANLQRNLNGDPVVFNPTVPGKGVYALFGFVGINDFSHILKSLDQDVVMLINDVAKVVHNEVFRWGHRDHGQCNKNNGETFLMVYRIGEYYTVKENRKIAADLMFSSPVERGVLTGGAGATSSRKQKNALEVKMNSIKLITLPGITGFTDRALLGMLKSFSGIRKEESLKRWESSFELGAGVGCYSVELIFGLHAGWAVEGAVGSTYKVDATYLSPHVNMASRMMAACKQYGVFVLLSQDFEELLSKEAKDSLRHIDTVYVKGSSVAQQIYTYDVRHNGVDFFLLDRTEEGADKEADQYCPEIWSRDQDLKAMRDHITPEFNEAFRVGRQYYVDGKWKLALEKLTEANDIMIQNVVDDGNITEVAMYGLQIKDKNNQTENVCRLRHEIGDGPCEALISFMEKQNCNKPEDWDGVRQLLNK